MANSFSEITEVMKKELYPSLLIGASCAVLGPVMYGVDPSISLPLPLINISAPSNVVLGASVAASNFIGAVAEDFILKNVDSSTAQSIEMIVRPVTNGIASYGVLRYGLTDLVGFQQSFALGAASTVAGQYAAETFQLN